jgi:ankyrin repeat protein
MNSRQLRDMLVEAKDNTRMIEMLLSTHKQFINDPIHDDMFNDSILMDIVYKNWETLVLPLIKHGADVNARNQNGMTALSRATRDCQTSIAITLIENGADVNHAENDGDTALHYCDDKSLEIAKCLVKHGADINRKNHSGKTPLKTARNRGSSLIVRYLQSLNAPQKVGQTTSRATVQQRAPNPPFSKVFIERIWPAMSTEQRIDAVNNMSPDELMTIKTTLGAIF